MQNRTRNTCRTFWKYAVCVFRVTETTLIKNK